MNEAKRNRVLIVAPDFAPSSYPPALRVRFFARHLPEFGWTPTILTIAPEAYEWTVDPENERLLPQGLEVVRTGVLPSRLTRRFGVGDLGIRSLWHHWRVLRRLCRERAVDLVFLPVPPFAQMALGRLAHARFGVPYVVDYIDPWVVDDWQTRPRARRRPKRAAAHALALALEPFSLKRVGHIVGVSSGTTDGVVDRYPWLGRGDATEIPYGGEPSDFEYLRRCPRRNPVFSRGDGLVHLGCVGRGGADLTGSLRVIFRALRRGLETAPETFGRVRVHFVGTTYAANADGDYQILPLATAEGLADLVTEHPGRVSYLDALQILLDCDALLAFGSCEAHYTASKIFPYVLSGRPLLGVFHEESTVVRFLADMETGDLITFRDPGDLEGRTDEALRRLMALLDRARGTHEPVRPERFEPYSARAMTRRLAAAFDQAVARSRRSEVA